MSERQDRDLAATDRALEEQRWAGKRAGSDERTRMYLELRAKGRTMTEAMAEVDLAWNGDPG